jgi:hypothetical protein
VINVVSVFIKNVYVIRKIQHENHRIIFGIVYLADQKPKPKPNRNFTAPSIILPLQFFPLSISGTMMKVLTNPVKLPEPDFLGSDSE